ncbi:MAG: family 20 glycosylhydrolase [Clostridia bacterium]|nr:family 20 glycosylhydrolase [Clostridia bacterium]
MLKSGKKILSLILSVCMLICLIPTAVFASDSGGYMKIAMLDCGRKYFTVDWVKSLIYETKADGFTHVMLAVGNDGMRFLLDDMSLTVGSKTYSSEAVKAAVISGNNSYTTASTGEWTESEMNEIFSAAASSGIEIIPLLNTPGHMDAILSAATSLTGTNCSYNGSVRTIDVTNTTAVAFSQAFVQKYIDYFAAKGCTYFNFGADEYANDRYTSGSMGFGSLQSSGKYGYFIKYVNEIAAMVKDAGLTPIAFNDGIEFANKTSASVGSTTYTFDKDIVVCYWSGGWSGYTPRTAANLASDGFKIINTTGDFYYVLGKSDNFDSSYTYASNWSNYKVCGTTLSSSSVLGGMFCMWSDYPGAETETQEAKKIRLPLRAMGLAMDSSYTYNLDTSVVPGGFNADGTLNTDPPAQVHNYQLTSSQEATCTEEGKNTYTCTDCGDSYTETTPALGHDYVAEDDGGDTVYTCKRCGDSYTELLPRENISLKAGQTSETYTLDGEKTISVEGDSGIAKANLTYSEGTGAEVSYSASASASVSGYTQGGYYCVISNIIDGNTSTYYWSEANQSVGMYARVDLGAEVRFDAVQVSAPAHGDYCTNANVQLSSDGYNWTTIGTFTSSRSSATTKTYTVPDSVESFRYIQVVITTARSYWWQLSEIAWGSLSGSTFTRAAASGTVQTGTLTTTELSFTGVGAGTTSYVVDGVKYVIEVEENHVHSWEKTSETAPTCTADGTTTYTCSVCGDTYTETTPATGHSYNSVVTAPTCTDEGYTTHTCSTCGDTYTDSTVPALGHDYVETISSATCTTNGVATYTCSRCGDTYTEAIPATGHKYTATVVEPTCTEDGTTTYTCSVCGDTYTETTPATGHSYTSVVTEPTCTEDGYTTYTCENCGDSYTSDVVPSTGHSYTSVVTEPTCTEDGYTTYTCESCGDTYTDDVVPATGHDYECTEEDGDLVYTCKNCGDTYRETSMPTVNVELNVGETYSFSTDDADITEDIDSDIATVTVHTNEGGYNAVSSLTDGEYLIISGGKVLTDESSTYYSSWDGAGTVYGLTCTSYSSSGSYEGYLWTITEVDGGYTVRNSDGLYLTITSGTRSSHLTLSETEQVIDISDLGSEFALSYSGTYLDRYSSTIAASYPGNVNENEKWELYKSEPASYDITITAVSGGKTSTVIGGTKYVVSVHEHDYVSEVTSAATCTDDGTVTYTCTGCGDSYTETIKAYGHDYECTEEEGYYLYTCKNCGDSYTEEISSTSYEYVSSLTSGGKYIITLYNGGTYYALTHNGTSLGATAVTINNGEITSEVTDDMLWEYSSNKLGFSYGSRTYYLSRSYGYYSSVSLSTYGSNVSYSYNRLALGSYYLRYSNGYISTSRNNYSPCYIYAEVN